MSRRREPQIKFTNPSHSQDGTGQNVLTYPGGNDYMTVPGSVQDMSGQEVMRAGQVAAVVTGRVEINYPADSSDRIPQPEDRITYTESRPNGQARTLEIVAVQRDPKNPRRLWCWFKEAA